MGERCPTCHVTDREQCKIRDLDLGCDHPDHDREMEQCFNELLSGELLAKHRAMTAAWYEANGLPPPPVKEQGG